MKPEPLRISLFLYITTTACGPTSNTDTSQASSSTTDISGGTTSNPGSTTGVDPTTTATTTTTTPTSETGVSSSSDDSTFITKPDGGGSCLASTDPDKQFRCTECDVFQQNCPPGQKCTAWASDGGGAWNATRCVEVTGTKGPGDECTTEGGGLLGIDDCQKGAMCWDVDKDTNMGTCVALCTGTPDAPVCDPGFNCAIFTDGALNLCLPQCDPLLQDCPGDDLCIAVDDDFLCALDASGDMGKTNDPCEFKNACDKGLACSPTATASSACMQDATGCCQPFCDFIAMEPCPNPDQKCVQWFDPMLPIPPGQEDVGICAIPP